MAWLDDKQSLAVSTLRLGRGWFTRAGEAPRPVERLELYEFEACPFCRKVREHLSELDLEYLARTIAKGSATRDELRERGGKVQAPYLVDRNTGAELYESEEIIDYLHSHYGSGRSRLWRGLAPFNTLAAGLAGLVRPRGGRVQVARAQQPLRTLELYNFEASPYCRKVREALCELDLDYIVHNVARKSRRRAELVARGGKMMVPYLVDPNTDTEMYESDDIVHYLWTTYG